jgi:amidase
MSQQVFETATDVASMVRNKQISARELTALLLARIDAVNPALNAVVELRGEAALHEASAADQALAKGMPGPLHGVPMTVKEAFNVVGLHTTWGNPAFKDYVAAWDATVVRRLRQSGAIIVGKSNVAFMLGDFGQTTNELFGTTNNPWDTRRAPGGSSGGGAAATAAGMSFLEFGSDVVGSIRIPASFCGVYGLKPSVGIVPVTGLQPPGLPPPPDEMTYMSGVGPLARSATDLRLALQVAAGPEGPACTAYTWRLAPPRHQRLRDFRVGVVLDHPLAPPSSEVGSLLSNAVDALARAGATVAQGWPHGVDPARAYEAFGYQVGLFFAYQEPDASFPGQSEFIEREKERMFTRAAWLRYFEDFDVFLCPTNFTPAVTHDDRPFEQRTVMTPEGEQQYGNQAFWVSHASLPGLPAISAPIGQTPGGLPVGIQIIGPLFEDDTALTFAELLPDLLGGYKAPPQFNL